MKHVSIDERRQVVVAKTEDEAYEFCLSMVSEEIQKAIATRACCSMAISGGKTPLRLYELLAEPSAALRINWPLLDIFWCDERCVPPTDSRSNYGSAAPLLSTPPLNQAKLHRLPGDAGELERAATEYERLVKKTCSGGVFDVVLLGIGEDGHTASLFPNTPALQEMKRLYLPVHPSEEIGWRLTMTFKAIESARSSYALVLGKSKAKILKQIFFGSPSPDTIPAVRLGTKEQPITYIIDKKAAFGLGL